jgi:integrase
MASIQRVVSPLTGSVSYRVQVRVKGRSAESETFRNRKDAKEYGAALESAIVDGRHFPSRRAKQTTFAGLVARYRENVLKDARASKRVTCEQHLTWWDERFLGRTLAEVTPDLVAEARDALAAEKFTRGKPRTVKGKEIAPKEYTRSGATINRYLATLSHVFTVAVREWRLLDRNPATSRDISKRKEARGRVRFLSDDERDALLAACAKSDWPALHTLVLLAISTGARRGELIRLKWDDVDLKAARVVVHDSKNGDPRVLPLVGKALPALRELKLQGSAQSPWVFPQPSGFPGPYVNFDSQWYAALEAAKVGDFRFHDLRHTCASYLASQGASLLEIADVLGHRTMAMVKRYSHLAQSHKTTAIEKMARERGL